MHLPRYSVPMRPWGNTVLLSLLISYTYYQPANALETNANFMSLCRERRDEMIIMDPSLQNNTALECRESYEKDKPPAMTITIDVAQCLERRPGYQGSRKDILSQWVGPLVGFLLPALAFVISIPRPMRLPRREHEFSGSKIKAIPFIALALLMMLFDILFWIITVFAFAGPLIASSIHEILIDHHVINYATKVLSQDRSGALTAVAFTLVGSLNPDKGDLKEKVMAHITNSRYAHRKLLSLLGLLPSYGTRVGIPIVFYLAAYAYALADARSKLGDNDTAHAIAFGLWYGVVVIVAIVSSSVLGVDNPASLEGVFSENFNESTPVASDGQEMVQRNSQHTSEYDHLVLPPPSRATSPASNEPTSATGNNQTHANSTNQDEPLIAPTSPRRIPSHIYQYHDSPFRTAWLWARARVFQHWVCDDPRNGSRDYPLDISLVNIINSSSARVQCGIIASILLALPCAGACYISYQTPSVGFGCRSVAHLIYATSQILLIGVWWMYYNSQHRVQQRLDPEARRFTLLSMTVYALSTIFVVAALASLIAATIMQLVGVFKNCVCKAGMQYLMKSARIPGAGEIILSNDTKAHRDHAGEWMIVGSIGIGMMGGICLLGWFWQVRVRGRCRELLERIGRL